MHIDISQRDDITICRVAGEVDINTAPEVKTKLDRLVKDRKEKVIINMEKVTYIDSSGLATLVELLKNFRRYGAKLKLTGLTIKIKSLFEITKLDKLFDIFQSEEDAIKAF